MNIRFVGRGLSAVALLGLGACAAPTTTEIEDGEAIAEVAAAQRVLAEVDIAGGQARFLEIDADTLLVETDTVGVPSPLRDPGLRGLSISEIYEYWSGEAAPFKLADHPLHRAQPDIVVGDEPAERELPEGVAATSAALLSAAEFQVRFCGQMQFCWLDRTGTWEREQRAQFWLGHIDSVRGDLSIQMRRKEVFGGWTAVWGRDVLSGHLVGGMTATSDALYARPLKFKIFNADGDHWHVAADWWN